MSAAAGVVFVSDDARVIRRSELLRLYEIAGDMRTLGLALGVPHTRVHRALRLTEAEKASKSARLEATRAAILGEDSA